LLVNWELLAQKEEGEGGMVEDEVEAGDVTVSLILPWLVIIFVLTNSRPFWWTWRER
jgi:hypothetical protein